MFSTVINYAYVSDENYILSFDYFVEGSMLAICYFNLWSNTVLKIANNDTFLIPYSCNGSTNFATV